MITPPRVCRYCGRMHRMYLRSPYLASGVYRFVCPDGRSYVGSVAEIRNRGSKLNRSNSRIRAAVDRYPPETWSFEVLERLTPNCDRHAAEQRHMDRLRSWHPRHGFNICPAALDVASPAARTFYENEEYLRRQQQEAAA
jgi:hypothetical protein